MRDWLEFNAILKRLQDGEGETIGALAAQGDDQARKIIRMYDMVYRCPENGAIAIFECYYNEWRGGAAADPT